MLVLMTRSRSSLIFCFLKLIIIYVWFYVIVLIWIHGFHLLINRNNLYHRLSLYIKIEYIKIQMYNLCITQTLFYGLIVKWNMLLNLLLLKRISWFAWSRKKTILLLMFRCKPKDYLFFLPFPSLLFPSLSFPSFLPFSFFLKVYFPLYFKEPDEPERNVEEILVSVL